MISGKALLQKVAEYIVVAIVGGLIVWLSAAYRRNWHLHVIGAVPAHEFDELRSKVDELQRVHNRLIESGKIDVRPNNTANTRHPPFPVIFSKPFSKKPKIVAAISELNIPQGMVLSVEVKTITESDKGFTCVFDSHDTRVDTATIQWIAYED